MRRFLRYLHSDFLKIKRRPVLWVHIFVPIAGIVLFLLLYIFDQKASPGSTASGLLGSITTSFPTLIGVVCSMIAEQESEADNFQGVLTCPSKLIPFLSMTVMLLLLGLASVLLTSFGFKTAFAIFLHQEPFGAKFYFQGAFLVYASNIFIYMFHLILSFRFNKGASIGIGIVESMLSALLITGLGDGRWILIPCAWGLRFLKVYSLGAVPVGYRLDAGIVCCSIGTVMIFLFSLIWFLRWEGMKTEE